MRGFGRLEKENRGGEVAVTGNLNAGGSPGERKKTRRIWGGSGERRDGGHLNELVAGRGKAAKK